jgi:hypothetical protein
MNKSVYIGAIVLGIIALLVGVAYMANIVLGSHPTRAYAAFGVGVVLLLIGIVGMVMRSRRSV